jgi:hypothetical protein
MAAWVSIIPRVLALTLMVATGTATAQDTPSVRVRGEIASVDGQLLTVRTREGATERVELAPEAKLLAVAPAELGAIAPGTFIGTAAVPRSDGKLTALEVVVFPKSMRGTGEGHYGWDLAPESTMTNATVYAAEAATDGRMLMLRYPEGEKTIVVPPQAPVVSLEPGDVTLLRPGWHVFVPSAARRPDGTLSTNVVAIGKDGLVPPM